MHRLVRFFHAQLESGPILFSSRKNSESESIALYCRFFLDSGFEYLSHLNITNGVAARRFKTQHVRHATTILQFTNLVVTGHCFYSSNQKRCYAGSMRDRVLLY